MSDNKLFKPSDSITESKINLTKSLKERLTKLKVSLKHTLLLDLSGSMEEYTADNKSKRDALEEIVKKLPESLKKYAFSDHTEKIEGFDFPRMGGSTNMTGAFQEMHRQGINEIILITDGEPDSPKTALDSARGLKIEIIYIGPLPRPQFLEDLANKSGANFTSIDMLQTGSGLELENKLKGLLGA